jgi:hypothetical protein
MDFDSYQKRYGYRTRDLERYLERGLIKGARRIAGGRWFIPEDVRPDYVIRKKASRRFEDDAFDFLKALNMRRAVSARVLLCTEGEYQRLIRFLLREGLVVEEEKHTDHAAGEGFSLTQHALDLLSQRKDRFVEWCQTTIAAAAKGVVS